MRKETKNCPFALFGFNLHTHLYGIQLFCFILFKCSLFNPLCFLSFVMIRAADINSFFDIISTTTPIFRFNMSISVVNLVKLVRANKVKTRRTYQKEAINTEAIESLKRYKFDLINE